MEKVVQCNQPAPDHRLVTPGNGFISVAQCSSLMLADLAISSSYSQVQLGGSIPRLSSFCINPLSATLTALFMDPLDDDRDDWAKRMTVHRMDHFVYLTIEFCSDEVTF